MRRLLLPATALASVAATLMIFLYAPTEALQGNVQRLFYIHVPSAWIAYCAFAVVAVASVGVLNRRDMDSLAKASAEIGVVFTTVVLITGMIWGSKVWGTPWVWDARLTSTLILWLIYLGYLAFRAATPAGETQARRAAVIGIIGAVDIPIIHFAVIWWANLHPQPVVLNPSGPQLPSEMLATLIVSLVAFSLIFVTLLKRRSTRIDNRLTVQQS